MSWVSPVTYFSCCLGLARFRYSLLLFGSKEVQDCDLSHLAVHMVVPMSLGSAELVSCSNKPATSLATCFLWCICFWLDCTLSRWTFPSVGFSESNSRFPSFWAQFVFRAGFCAVISMVLNMLVGFSANANHCITNAKHWMLLHGLSGCCRWSCFSLSTVFL